MVSTEVSVVIQHESTRGRTVFGSLVNLFSVLYILVLSSLLILSLQELQWLAQRRPLTESMGTEVRHIHSRLTDDYVNAESF